MALLLAGCSHVSTDLQEDNALLQSRAELGVFFEWDCIDGSPVPEIHLYGLSCDYVYSAFLEITFRHFGSEQSSGGECGICGGAYRDTTYQWGYTNTRWTNFVPGTCQSFMTITPGTENPLLDLLLFGTDTVRITGSAFPYGWPEAYLVSGQSPDPCNGLNLCTLDSAQAEKDLQVCLTIPEIKLTVSCIDGKGACTTKVYSATQFTEDDFGFQDYCPDCL